MIRNFVKKSMLLRVSLAGSWPGITQKCVILSGRAPSWWFGWITHSCWFWAVYGNALGIAGGRRNCSGEQIMSGYGLNSNFGRRNRSLTGCSKVMGVIKGNIHDYL